jgi:hypothetical protein
LRVLRKIFGPERDEVTGGWKIFGPERDEVTGGWKNCIKRSFMIRTAQEI